MTPCAWFSFSPFGPLITIEWHFLAQNTAWQNHLVFVCYSFYFIFSLFPFFLFLWVRQALETVEGAIAITRNKLLHHTPTTLPTVKPRSTLSTNTTQFSSLATTTTTLPKFTAFSNLREAGSIIITFSQWEEFDEGVFSSLETVHDTLEISNSQQLLTLNRTFPSLTKTSNLRISSNNNLGNIGGFELLSNVTGELAISKNAALDLVPDDFANIKVVQKLSITSNGRIRSLNGIFQKLEEVKGSVTISGNSQLVNATTFAPQLNFVLGNVDISSNNQLLYLPRLPTLDNAEGRIIVSIADLFFRL